MHRRQAILGSLAALASIGAYRMTSAITSPRPNQVLQKGASGTADFNVEARGSASSFKIMDGTTLVQESTYGEFTGVPIGMHTLQMVSSGSVIDSIPFGVGNVYLVAGQSNAKSHLNPITMSLRGSVPGRAIVSNLDPTGAARGLYTFVDSYDVQPTWSACWIHCANVWARSYPSMFVNVAESNTSTSDWVNNYFQRIPYAWELFKAKAILWHQGENSGSFGDMDAMVESLRQMTGCPWVVALNGYPSGTNAPIRAAQQQLIDKWSHVYQGPDTDTIARGSDGVHYEGNGLLAHGQAWADTLAGLYL